MDHRVAVLGLERADDDPVGTALREGGVRPAKAEIVDFAHPVGIKHESEIRMNYFLLNDVRALLAGGDVVLLGVDGGV